jgi:hypothetical protein
MSSPLTEYTVYRFEQASPSVVRSEVSSLSQEIITSYLTLRNIVERHEQQLETRWKHMSPEKRTDLLLKILPHVPKNSNPDFEAFKWRRCKHVGNSTAEDVLGGHFDMATTRFLPYQSREILAQRNSELFFQYHPDILEGSEPRILNAKLKDTKTLNSDPDALPSCAKRLSPKSM